MVKPLQPGELEELEAKVLAGDEAAKKRVEELMAEQARVEAEQAQAEVDRQSKRS